jgi:competence ComEA-like helix-hairpin-helix protein
MRCPKKYLAVVLLLPLTLGAQRELPEGAGRETVKKVCGNCHEVETVISSRRTKMGWQAITDDMISRGAEGTEEEMAAVVAYLTGAFGKVNVNTASPDDLQNVLGIPDKEAQAIVSYREQNGRIKNFDELERVPGVDGEKLKGKRSLVAFSQ